MRLPGGRVEVEGTVQGQIIDTPRGNQGFGYDPIFYYSPCKKTFGESDSWPRSVRKKP